MPRRSRKLSSRRSRPSWKSPRRCSGEPLKFHYLPPGSQTMQGAMYRRGGQEPEPEADRQARALYTASAVLQHVCKFPGTFMAPVTDNVGKLRTALTARVLFCGRDQGGSPTCTYCCHSSLTCTAEEHQWNDSFDSGHRGNTAPGLNAYPALSCDTARKRVHPTNSGYPSRAPQRVNPLPPHIPKSSDTPTRRSRYFTPGNTRYIGRTWVFCDPWAPPRV